MIEEVVICDLNAAGSVEVADRLGCDRKLTRYLILSRSLSVFLEVVAVGYGFKCTHCC